MLRHGRGRLLRGALSASTNFGLEPASHRGLSLEALLRWCVWLIPGCCLAMMIGVFLPRFGIQSASLVDDWFSLTYAPTAVHQLIHGHYDTAVVDYGGRYRPSYALLNEAQWMFGSRNSTLAPNLFGLARLLFFAGAVAAIVAAVLRRSASRPWVVVASSIVPTMIVAAPGMSYNFVRFGIAEPTAIAAVAVGLACMTATLQCSLTSGSNVSKRRSAATFTAGYGVYVFGAYLSEACAAIVVLLPSIYYWISRDPAFVRSRRAKAILALAAVLVLLPIGHVFWEIAPKLGSDHGNRTMAGVIFKLVRPAGPTLSGLLTTGNLIWPLLVLLTLALSARQAFRKDREGILITGMILSGLAAAYIAELGTSGNTLSRYYIPLLVAVGVGFVWLLGSLEALPRSIITAAVLAVMLAGRGDQTARAWLELDHGGDKAIALASAANATGCRVYLVDFPDERRMGLARVLNNSGPGSLATCHAADRSAYAIWWRLYSATSSTTAPAGCETRWRRLGGPSSVELFRCSRFGLRRSVPSQDTLTRTRMVRLVPPTHWIDASALNGLAYADR